MVSAIRIVTSSSRGLMARQTRIQPSVTAIARPYAATFHSSIRAAKEPTHSEDAVKAEKHDKDIDQLAEQTSKNATQEFQSDNKKHTDSEEAVHADRHSNDPLPEHKKKKSSQ